MPKFVIDSNDKFSSYIKLVDDRNINQITKDSLTNKFESINSVVDNAENYLLKQLAKKALSIAEAKKMMENKLLEDGSSDDIYQITKNIIDSFIDRGYLSDDLLAEQLLKQAKQKHYGITKYKQSMAIRKINISTQNEYLTKYYEDEHKDNIIYDAANKKVNSLRNLEYDVAFRRLSSYLQRRGFSLSESNKISKEVLGQSPKKNNIKNNSKVKFIAND